MNAYHSDMDYRRGDILFVNKGKFHTGSEQEEGRPAVIISNDVGNMYSPVVEVVYLTTQEKKPMPTHVEVLARIPSTVLYENIATVSKERLGEYIRTCTDKEMKELDQALAISIGLTEIPKVESNIFDDADKQALEKELEDLKKACRELIKDNSDLQNKVMILSEASIPNDDIIKITAERDLYKQLFEQAYERLISA